MVAKKPAKPKAKKPSKEAILEEKAHPYDRIRAKEKERRKLLSRFDELTKERKAAREAMGFCETEICGLGHALDEKHPLFDQKPAEQTATTESAKANEVKGTDAEQKQPEENTGTGDVCRKLSLADAGFLVKQIDALEAAGIRTLGELQEAMNRHGQFWAKNLGVSGRLRQAIEDAFNAYLMQHASKAA
jgi:hypothetical protein